MSNFARALLALFAATLAGCSTTEQARNVETAGFLGDYSRLREGAEGESLLIYKNLDADFSGYNKVMVDPITVWRSANPKQRIPQEDLQRLANYLHARVVAKLGEDYEIVQTPVPNALRIRAAITEATKSIVVLDTLSTVVPITRAISEAKRLATGTQAFVGAASIELRVTDAESGAVLFEAVDRRSGKKAIGGMIDSWSDVEEALDFWANRLSESLREFREGGRPKR